MKRTLQEIANFFQMAVAIDENNKAYLYSKRPHWKDSGWRVIGGGAEVFMISRELIDYTGDCRDSLALPESWPQFKKGELVIHCLDEKQIAIWPPAMDKSEDLWRRPTAEEKRRMLGA